MFRPASRRLIVASTSTASFRPASVQRARRLISTAPPTQKSRSWKSSALRWGLAIGGVYYYNTSNVFAEEVKEAYPQLAEYQQEEPEPEPEASTIDEITERKRRAKEAARNSESARSSEEEPTRNDAGSEPPRTAQEYEDEADSQGAFNPETGEINWDCPCLGGMAHGPCGEDFRAAFSCFVFSKEEPKGMDCIDKFKGMQDCFRRFPDVYGAELEDDEDGQEEEANANDRAMEAGSPSTHPPPPSSNRQDVKPSSTPEAGQGEKVASVTSDRAPASEGRIDGKRKRAGEAANQMKEVEPQAESPALVPRAAHNGSEKSGS